MLLVVIVLEEHEFAVSRGGIPEAFLIGSIVIIAIGLGSLGLHAFLSANLSQKQDRLARFASWWSNDGSHFPLATTVFVLAIMNIAVLWFLVDGTGRGLASPYAPLLTVPAVFGAFFTNNWYNTLGLTLTVAALICYADLYVASASDVPTEDGEIAVPPHAIAAVSLLLVVIPGIVSASLQWFEQRNHQDSGVTPE